MIGPCRAGLFETATGKLAFPAGKLQTVLDNPPFFQLPGMPDSLPGVLLYQTQIVPLIRWDGPAIASSGAGAGYAVILTTEYGLVGFPVTRVRQVIDGTAEQPVPEEFADLPGVIAGFRNGADIYPLIDIDNMVESLTNV